MPTPLELALLGIVVLWLFGLTFLIFRFSTHYNNLTKGVTNKSLKSVLETLFKDLKLAQKDIDSLSVRCDTIEKDGALHIQKIGLLRFNPFKDTGGDQSFILSLVDKKDTGVVISGLYSRSGTRWYAKRIAQGKGIEHELSDDEKNALKETHTV